MLQAFKELTKNDESNIQTYENHKAEKIRNQNEHLDDQEKQRQVIIEGDNKKPRDTYYEDLWARQPPGTKMPKKGSGNYSRDPHVAKTGNRDETRHMKAEAQRLRYRGQQYMSMSSYEIQKAKKVRMFINCNVMLLNLNFFNININSNGH